MSRLKKKIIERIEREGPIPFRSFMEMCLYDPTYGYYRTRKVIGRDGDFFTSAHVGSLLGRLLARRLEAVAPADGPVHVVELGAGEGYIARDLLDALAREDLPLYQRVQFHFVEQNEAVFAGNQDRLREHLPRVVFYSTLDELPRLNAAFIYSNEFFDAFPVHLLTRRDGQLAEVYVGYRDPYYTRVFKPLSDAARREVRELKIQVGEGCTIEVNSDIEPVYATLADRCERCHVVTIDYGYTQDVLYHPERTSGTLMGYHKHGAYENVFQLEGEMDLTSHVNFDALIHYGEKHGIRSTYFKNQRSYLMDHGLFDLFKNGEEPSAKEAFQLKTLLLPGQMGDVFRVLVQEKDGAT